MLRSFVLMPILICAILVELVIFVMSFQYQRIACMPPGMEGVFLGIGPMGVIILLVELMKLPVAAWAGWRRGVVRWLVAVPAMFLTCVLTFQVVRDMAVYEIHQALAPADRLHEEALKAEMQNQLEKSQKLYEEEVVAISNTQVHRLATTVALLRGEPAISRPLAKDRALNDREQIATVRIWVYPIWAFVIAYLPSLMVAVAVAFWCPKSKTKTEN